MSLSADLHGGVQKALTVEAWRALGGVAAAAAAGKRAAVGEPGAGGESLVAPTVDILAWPTKALC